MQKYTGVGEICGPQNDHFCTFLGVFGGNKQPKNSQIHQKQPKMYKSGHFAGHISPQPLYIFAKFKMWDAREHPELQYDRFGLCSKKSWLKLKIQIFRFFPYLAQNDGASVYFDLIVITGRSIGS
jgi:hypothetical protein